MKRLVEILTSFYEKKVIKKVDYVLTLLFVFVFNAITSFFLAFILTSLFQTVFPIIFLLGFLIILTIISIALMCKKKLTFIRVIATMGIVLFSIDIYLLVIYIYRTRIPIVIFDTFKIFVICLETSILIYIMPKPKLKSIFTIASVMSIIIGSIVYTSGLSYNKYLESIAIVNNENIDTNKYLAFNSSSNIARLPDKYQLRENEKFKYKDKLPVVDGAAALFPMYSSFVEAIYPKNIGKLNQNGSPYTYHNTPAGYMRLAYGDIDIMFGVHPSQQQISRIEENEKKLELIEYGKEAFVFFVNESNPVESLTIEQVKKIYSGEIKNWKELGGANEEIKAFQRNQNSGSQTAMEKFMGNIPLMRAPQDYYYSTMMGIVRDVADYKNFKGAIGYSYLYYAKTLVEDYEVKMLKIEGIAPTIENVSTGTYPICEGIYMAVTKRNDDINKMIDFVLSKRGQYLVKQSGYAPLYDYNLE